MTTPRYNTSISRERCGRCGHRIGDVPSSKMSASGSQYHNDCDKGRDQEILYLGREIDRLKTIIAEYHSEGIDF